MCELFGISAGGQVVLNDYLKEFFSHSTGHPNGWGMALLYGNAVNVEKEPVPAYESAYLRERLRHRLSAQQMIAHIRLATRGLVTYENSHPFVMRDQSGRVWVLAHNGTVFDCPALNGYIHEQEGRTDSERILCHIVRSIDRRMDALGRALDARERFHVLDDVMREISSRNKINLLISDGELLYVHTNYADSLHFKRLEEGVIFSTVPLDRGKWEPVKLTALLAYRDGELVIQGTAHGQEYKDNPEDMRMIYMDYADL